MDRNSALSETLHILRQQQQQACRQGERLLVESLISAVATPLPVNELHDLIVAEVTLRQERGETCTSVEYVQRFPQLAETLQRLFAQNDGDPFSTVTYINCSGSRYSAPCLRRSASV